jgi:fatty acid desaturase
MSIALVPSPQELKDVLPSERLLANGVAIPELRTQFRHISNWRNARAVIMVWLWTSLLAYAGVHWGIAVALVAFVLMGPIHARFAILMHESAHRLLFKKKKWNDVIGTWFIAYPAFIPISIYRRSHFAHHREEFGPDEPDMAFYRGYPCPMRDLRRRLLRDAVGISGYKNFVALVAAAFKPSSRRVAGSILGVQVVMFALFWLLTGAWWSYLAFWWLPWMTQWRVLNRLRAIAEHGGMAKSGDRRLTTHNVRQTWLARFWFVPYNTGWHLAHHVDMGVPWHSLPAYHRELHLAGYVTEGITFKNYFELWRSATTPAIDAAERDDINF